MSDRPLTDSQKLDRVLKLCEGMATTLVEHHVELKFLHSQLDIHAEDAATMSSKLKELKAIVEQLEKIARGQDMRLREDRASIHELQEREERRAAGNSNAPR